MAIKQVFLTYEAYGRYDRVDLAPPSVNDDSSAGYYVGFAWLVQGGNLYECTDDTVGAAVWAVDTNEELRINNGWRYLLNTVFSYLNLPVPSSNAYRANTISITGSSLADSATELPVQDDEYFLLTGSNFNDGTYYATGGTAALITIDGSFPRDEVAGSDITVDPVILDPGVEHIIARMVAYDVWERYRVQGVDSESAAGSSTTYQSTTSVGGLQYPTSVVAGLREWKRPKYI